MAILENRTPTSSSFPAITAELKHPVLDPVPAQGFQLHCGLLHPVPHPRGQECLERRGPPREVHQRTRGETERGGSCPRGIQGLGDANQPGNLPGQPTVGEMPAEG